MNQSNVLTVNHLSGESPVQSDPEEKGHPVPSTFKIKAGTVAFVFNQQMKMKSSIWCLYCFKNQNVLTLNE